MKQLILFALMLIPAMSLSAQEHKYSEHYYERINEFAQQAPITQQDIVMLGNSLTEFAGDWSARIGKPHIINRGIIGDEAMGVYDRLYQILPGKPRKLFLLIGVNDVSHNLSADSIVGLITLIVDKIRQDTPTTKLYLQSLLPINESFHQYRLLTGKTDYIPLINKKLKAMAKSRHIKFINLFNYFKEKDSNSLKKEISIDGLHLNENGYAIWCKRLKQFLQ
ncbi:MAG: GDSL-type esterase/lipase family protein [Phocaeicola sp.]|uniref:GDSL-type esterase/lipase family protein n=1 Tax=Phocaeicola sp. TaxID=2773926 RepID=UPI003FA0972E